MNRTVLYEEHVRLGAKMVEFAGFEMPIEYVGITEEHLAVREKCGMFDVSHMGEIMVEGVDAKKFVNHMVTSGVPNVSNRMIYGILLYPDGGIVDDLMIYYYNDQKILLVVNASNLDKDFAWIAEHVDGYDVKVNNISASISQIALQGKTAVIELQKYTDYNLNEMKMYDFREFEIIKHPFIVSRSGYTGEDGFEIYGANSDILDLFKDLVEGGVMPCGLGARDTLRFEANMPLYGHEIDQTVNPLEATLTFALDFTKDFIGKDALLKVKEEGLKRKIVGLELIDRGIARGGYEVEKDGEIIGHITTGYLVPGINKAYALAMVKAGNWELGTEVGVRIRKNLVKAKVRDKKFLNKKYIK